MARRKSAEAQPRHLPQVPLGPMPIDWRETGEVMGSILAWSCKGAAFGIGWSVVEMLIG